MGGILGDEMGLGKTIQIISFLTGLRNMKTAGNRYRVIESFISFHSFKEGCPSTEVGFQEALR